jgi:hypothetical protein
LCFQLAIEFATPLPLGCVASAVCKVAAEATVNKAAANQGYCYHSAAFRPS